MNTTVLNTAHIPTTLSGALMLAARQAAQVEQQQTQLALAAPKIAFFDRYVNTTGVKSLAEMATLLHANPAELREFLGEHQILYRLGGELTPYQRHIDTGRFVVKIAINEATRRSSNHTMLTRKGMAWVAALWAVHTLDKEVQHEL